MAGGVLVDSDIVIRYFRRDEAVAGPPDSLVAERRAAWTPVSIAGVAAGLRPMEEAAIAALQGALYTLPLTEEVGWKAGVYPRRSRLSHRLRVPDAPIAAATHVCDLRLWTRNVGRYPVRDARMYRP